MEDLGNPSWEMIENWVEIIANKIGSNRPDCIVGLSRGGLVPAVLLSHAISVPMMPIVYSSTIGRGGKEAVGHNEIPPIPTAMAPNRVVMIVDDLIDSGHTIAEVRRGYEQMGYDVQVAVLMHKPSSPVVPTYNAVEIEPHDLWVTFPWERAKG